MQIQFGGARKSPNPHGDAGTGNMAKSATSEDGARRDILLLTPCTNVEAMGCDRLLSGSFKFLAASRAKAVRAKIGFTGLSDMRDMGMRISW